eukprot:1161021-Pelagomonas_calceolata.AAC.7
MSGTDTEALHAEQNSGSGSSPLSIEQHGVIGSCSVITCSSLACRACMGNPQLLHPIVLSSPKHMLHEEGEQEHQDAMSKVSEHDSKQEGEGHDGEHSRVDFTIARHAIRIHDGLEAAGELVGLEVGGRVFMRHGHGLQHSPNLNVRKKARDRQKLRERKTLKLGEQRTAHRTGQLE